jgi:hypothetical protein
MSDSGKSDMRACNPVPTRSRVSKCLGTRLGSLRRIDIELNRHLRIVKLYDITVRDISPKYDLSVTTMNDNSAMAWRMPW